MPTDKLSSELLAEILRLVADLNECVERLDACMPSNLGDSLMVSYAAGEVRDAVRYLETIEQVREARSQEDDDRHLADY